MTRSRTYAVRTEAFGELLYETDEGIAAARAWARKAFGVRRKGDVRLRRRVRLCERCDSAPCCCR